MGNPMIEVSQTGTNAQVVNLPVFDSFAEYNRAIDDAVHALRLTGNDAWQIVRSLREPK